MMSESEDNRMVNQIRILLHELIESVEEDLKAIEHQLRSTTDDKTVDINSHGGISSLRKVRLQYEVLLSVIKEESQRE
jgi:hypothetical protein